MKALPMKLWLAIEDDVARHKAELAQAFAQARERLLPEPVSVWPEASVAARRLQDLLAGQQDILTPGYVTWEEWNDRYNSGLFGLGILGL